MTMKSFKCQLSQCCGKYLRQILDLFITNMLSLQLEALSNCYNFSVITILHNNDDILTWDCKNNNKYQATMS